MDIRQFAVQHDLKITRGPDEGTEIIPGRIGQSHIFAYDDERLGVVIMPDSGSSNYWTAARKAFEKAGMMITQNGDEEGVAVFDPKSREQVKLALRYAGVRKPKSLSPKRAAALEKARAVATRNRALKSSVQRAQIEPRNDQVAAGDTQGHPDETDSKSREKLSCTVEEALVHSLETAVGANRLEA
ncbi:MAG TPA: hypothetical protein VFA68_07700 [Terriglobales bacterium]|nr:hypothetical protein [Terriglobales bacterium]